MKRYSLAFAGLIGAALWSGAALAETDDARIAATLLDGSTCTVQDAMPAKPVLLKFWATWCGVCLQEMPAYVELHEKYGDKVRFLAVNVAIDDPRERVAAAVDEHDLKMPVAYDESGDLWDRYDVVGTPAYILFDSDGNILHRTNGHDDNLEPALESATTQQAQRSAVDYDGERR